MRKRDIQHFLQTATGEYNNEAGERLFIVPVYARMIGLDTMYLERTTAQRNHGTAAGARELTATAKRSCSSAYVFTQQGQWRNLLEQPELLSALQPNDVRAAGTCDITAGRGPELDHLHLRRQPADELPARAARRHRVTRRA